MDAIALLKADHTAAKKLMAELEETTERGGKTRQQHWTTLLKALTIHEPIEEEILYPALIEHPEAKDIVLEAMDEHHLVDDIVEQLKDTPVDDAHWGAKFTRSRGRRSSITSRKRRPRSSRSPVRSSRATSSTS